jgi:fructose-1,6-bisphosphatase/inositol monophosphatase family enzyme
VRWILDPIDGTESFVRGVPLYAVLVAVEVEGNLDVGVAHFPSLGETVAAARGLGCRRNGAPVRVSEVARLEEALVSTTSPGHFARSEHGAGWDRLLRAARKTRAWGDAYGHCLVATGRIDAMAEPSVALWDFAPLVPILEEAGGRITDFRGGALAHGSPILSTNGHIHGECLRAFAGR